MSRFPPATSVGDFAHLQAPLWVFDVERQRMVWANEAALALWESASIEELAARDFGADMSKSTKTRLHSYLKRFKRGESVTEQWTFYPQGEAKTVRCRCSGVDLEDGRLAMLVQGMVEDDTDVSSLRGVEALRHTSVMISMCTEDGKPLMENPAALRAYAHTEALPKGKHAFIVRFADSTVGMLALADVIEHRSYSNEVRVRTRSGYTWHGMDAHRTHDPVTGSPAIVINEKDIGWRVEAERELKKGWAELEATVAARTEELTQANAALSLSDRMASLGTLAAGVAHEINNPLTYIINNLGILEEEIDDPKHAELVADALAGSERVRRIVTDLGAFSRRSERDDQPVDLHDVIEFSLSLTAHELRPRAQVVRQFSPVPNVRGSESKVGQVIVNLLVNAAHAIEDGDATHNRIVIETKTDVDGAAMVTVSDTGTGIAEEDLPRVFDHFFTTKTVGMGPGLGLSICYRIVTELGGQITVESEAGRGTSVCVTLPMAGDADGASPASHRVDGATVEPAKLLVVDDEPMILRGLRRLLREHDVTTSSSGREAVAIAREHGPFDLVLCDLTMPDGSGVEVFEELTAISPSYADRILIMTGGATSESAERFLEGLSDMCVEKPFTHEELRTRVAKCLAARDAT